MNVLKCFAWYTLWKFTKITRGVKFFLNLEYRINGRGGVCAVAQWGAACSKDWLQGS